MIINSYIRVFYSLLAIHLVQHFVTGHCLSTAKSCCILPFSVQSVAPSSTPCEWITSWTST